MCVLFDLEPKGCPQLAVPVHRVFTLSQALNVLVQARRIPQDVAMQALSYLLSAPVVSASVDAIPTAVSRPLSYGARSSLCRNPVAQQLLQIMHVKGTNVTARATPEAVTTASALLAFAHRVGPHICLLITHMDLLTDFSPSDLCATSRGRHPSLPHPG